MIHDLLRQYDFQVNKFTQHAIVSIFHESFMDRLAFVEYMKTMILKQTVQNLLDTRHA